MSSPTDIVLPNGPKGMRAMPMIMLGTWKAEKGQVGAAVKAALEAGFRGIDCANDYGNEKEIGDTLAEIFKEGKIARKDLFIQAKLWNANHRREHVRPDLEASLHDLQIDYVDSYIIHWPQAAPAYPGGRLVLARDGEEKAPASEGTMFPLDDNGRFLADVDCHYIETWHAMEDLVDAGLTRSIGLSNFNSRQIREVMENKRKYSPAVLQNEVHPYLQQKDILDLCRHFGIILQGYSPLGSTRERPTHQKLLEDPRLQRIADRLGKSPAQIVLRWHVQRGVPIAVKSVSSERIKQNREVLNFKLEPEDMDMFDQLNIGWRHLLLESAAVHPDFPFKDELDPAIEIPKAGHK